MKLTKHIDCKRAIQKVELLGVFITSDKNMSSERYWVRAWIAGENALQLCGITKSNPRNISNSTVWKCIDKFIQCTYIALYKA